MVLKQMLHHQLRRTQISFCPRRNLGAGTLIKFCSNRFPMFEVSKIPPSLFFPKPPISTHINL
ncbi:unnamed protein product [Acanthoscelides obtectus]|uniref:Uncharacterized protein n=1 Tax=Acanthoscelides obtectus TaxID=200917 RepID=A0A9P0LYS2_ACAOB|nr:unnamed protein product [Acanthoscelides obtectus]CAK1676916.1 hypothetical protein AOBTE_LOCUS31001 [Acanthoscelides obtectus]